MMNFNFIFNLYNFKKINYIIIYIINNYYLFNNYKIY